MLYLRTYVLHQARVPVPQSFHLPGNKAIGRGGGAFVPQEGLLSVLACSADATLVVPSNATATTAAAANSTPPAPSVTLRLPGRHAPAWWYSQLSASRRAALLKRVGGPVQTTAAAAYTVNGTLFFAEGTVFAVQAGLNTTRVSPSGSTVAADGTVLTSSGGLVLSAASSAAGLLASVGGLPLVLHNSIINDTAWYGVPYNLLPCADWNNTATAGDNIGTSPYFLLVSAELLAVGMAVLCVGLFTFAAVWILLLLAQLALCVPVCATHSVRNRYAFVRLQSPPLVDFYTSNRDIDIAVTVHDWYGNNCTGNGTHQQSVTVRASSDLVGVLLGAGGRCIVVALWLCGLVVCMLVHGHSPGCSPVIRVYGRTEVLRQPVGPFAHCVPPLCPTMAAGYGAVFPDRC